ncbi:hypothetical protein [Microbispora sp. NPDC049633]|uniref:hypothetical protein n=1 Tax=Microbispora sp. NPDC049633 TaxID=3154355 RepID=UPI003446A2CD
MAYATADDLTDYLDPVPDDADLRLTRASRLVDQALLCAVYDVDDTGMPTDQRVIDALRAATCEQVASWVESGETGTGAADGYQSVSIGSVSLSRAAGGPGGGGSQAESLCPQARMVLQQAGLTGRGPYVDPLGC